MIQAIGALGASLIQNIGNLGAAAPTASAAPAAGPTSTNGASFEQMLGQVASDAVGTMQNGEAAAIQGVNGSMPTFKVVEQVMSAQRTLQQTLAMRDKAVSAYQEITRMAI